MAMHLSLHIKRGTPHEVRVLSLYGRAGSDIEETLASHGIPVDYLDKHPGLDLRMFRGISRVLKAFDPQVVHSHLYILRYLAPAILSRRRCRWIHTIHSVTARETDNIGQFIHGRLFRRQVTPVAISWGLGRSLESHYGLHNAKVVMNGIPVADYVLDEEVGWNWRRENGLQKDLLLYTCVASFGKAKNHLQLLDSFAVVSRKAPNARLLLVGDGELRGAILEKAARLGLQDKLNLLGVRHDIPAILAASDVFVLPSLWEGNPLALMEAMAAGLPCVATRVGGVPELVQDGVTGLLVEPARTDALSDAMSCLQSSATLRARLGQHAAAYARNNFGMERMGEKYLRIYGENPNSPGPIRDE